MTAVQLALALSLEPHPRTCDYTFFRTRADFAAMRDFLRAWDARMIEFGNPLGDMVGFIGSRAQRERDHAFARRQSAFLDAMAARLGACPRLEKTSGRWLAGLPCAPYGTPLDGACAMCSERHASGVAARAAENAFRARATRADVAFRERDFGGVTGDALRMLADASGDVGAAQSACGLAMGDWSDTERAVSVAIASLASPAYAETTL